MAFAFLLFIGSVNGGEIHQAIKDGDMEKIKHLISHGVDVDTPDELGITPLMGALVLGQIKTAEFLVNKGADVNARDKDGYTALMWIILVGSSENQTKAVEFLINNGADVNARDDAMGFTALMYASLTGNTEMVKLLTEVAAEI